MAVRSPDIGSERLCGLFLFIDHRFALSILLTESEGLFLGHRLPKSVIQPRGKA